jgi:hypothetical protein
MKAQLSQTLAWTYVTLIAILIAGAVYVDLSTRPEGDLLAPLEPVFYVIPLAFAFVGALIISRQPGNRIGLLMMGPSASMFVVVDAYLRPFVNGYAPLPETPSPVFLLILWFSNWNWTLLIFPLMYIMALFPNGRPLSRRWGWLSGIGYLLAGVLIFFSTFSESLSSGSGNADWSYPNPVGFIPAEWIAESAIIPFIALMPVWVVLSAVSLFVRFRRARGMEREQIKWLFYAGVVFALSYVPSFILSDFSEDYNIWNLLWGVGMLTFPAAIGIAILRYRLWDIDILIRRTLQYSILTGVLGLVYFGGVTVLQSLFSTISGQESPAALVISTLGIAALFNPLRRRTQDFIDRRFYRRKYNAEKVLADFAAITRQGADLEQLAGHLNVTLQETLQPDQIGLWLKSAHRTQQITQEQEK